MAVAEALMRMSATRVVFTAAAVVLAVWTCAARAWPSEGTPLRCPIVRDTWVSNAAGEGDGNNGGAPRLKTKSVQEFAVVDIDPAPLKGRVITGATLHLHCVSSDIQRRLSVSTLASDWAEGTSSGYRVQKGAASFNWARQDEQRWAYPGSDITAVMMGMGNTLWRFAEASPPDKDGWQVVAVEPAVVAARLAGISWGFVVMDDVGSEYERNGEKFTYKQFPNRFVSSREDRRFAPYMTVYLDAEDKEPPDPPQDMSAGADGLPAGEALVTWRTPADRGPAGTLGFIARLAAGQAFDWDSARVVPQYLVPMAGAPGTPVRMHLRDMETAAGATVTLGVRAVDAAGNVGPAGTVTFRVSDLPQRITLPAAPAKPFEPAGERPAVGAVKVAVIDALDKVNPVSGAIIPARPDSYLLGNHIWSAASRTVRLHAARNEFVEFQVVLSGQTGNLAARIDFDGKSPVRGRLYRFRHVRSKAGMLPDPLLPLEGAVQVPAEEEKIAGQQHAAIFAELYVPRDAPPGRHEGALVLESGGQSLSLKIDLHVWDFVLPDHLSFVPEMNCYGLPDPPGDTAYYRLAHVHRTCLNRLGYNWRGQVNPHAAPRWTGSDFDWTDWDRHYERLLDGSAFADLPRGPVPLEFFYLQLNENWPVPIDKYFRGGYWADQAFDPAYRKQFVEACAKMAEHLAARKWTQTVFEFYLNNKVYYKQGSWSRSSAPWILDEPYHTQDFWALRWYGAAFHEGVAPWASQVKLAFRCDISRPQWQRELLDGVMDVNVVGGDLRRYGRYVLDRKHRNGEITFNYGGTNNIEAANVQPAAWCIDTWALGLDGVLPWQTIGRAQSWSEADPLSLFYPGEPAGLKEPVPSVRLKAYRRGQQDVEYLTILTAALKAPRFAVAQTAREFLKLAATVDKHSADDAGLVSYREVDAVRMWELRLAAGAALDALNPPARRQYADFRAPVRDVAAMRRSWYVSVAPPAEAPAGAPGR